MPTRFVPRHVKGSSTRLLAGGPAWLGGAVLSSGSAASSLSLHNSATTVSLNSSSTRRLLLRAPASDSRNAPEAALFFATGISVSLSAGAVACLWVSERQR